MRTGHSVAIKREHLQLGLTCVLALFDLICVLSIILSLDIAGGSAMSLFAMPLAGARCCRADRDMCRHAVIDRTQPLYDPRVVHRELQVRALSQLTVPRYVSKTSTLQTCTSTHNTILDKGVMRSQ